MIVDEFGNMGVRGTYRFATRSRFIGLEGGRDMNMRIAIKSSFEIFPRLEMSLKCL